MALYAKGQVLTCRASEREYKDKKTGALKSFKSHRCFVYDAGSEGDPIPIDTGEYALEVGKIYRIPVYTSVYAPEGGKPVVQLKAMKDDPPREIKAGSGA